MLGNIFAIRKITQIIGVTPCPQFIDNEELVALTKKML